VIVDLMQALGDQRELLTERAPLAPLTWFRLGGPADLLARPQTLEQLKAIVAAAVDNDIPWRILAGGSNVLVRDEGFRGVVILLESPAFSDVSIADATITSGAAVPLTALISQSARAGLSGIEILTGIPGTVGGAIRGNSGSRQGAIGQFVERVMVLEATGKVQVRNREELDFDYRYSNLDDVVILNATLALEQDDPESVVRRMRRTWIVKKENQPYSHQSTGCIFKDPNTEATARMLIDQSGLKGLRIGGAEVSDRHANYIIAHPEASAADVLALIDQIRDLVRRRFGFDLELQLQIW
jgi:UDP-N-acetylmuramate dehydrogenase